MCYNSKRVLNSLENLVKCLNLIKSKNVTSRICTTPFFTFQHYLNWLKSQVCCHCSTAGRRKKKRRHLPAVKTAGTCYQSRGSSRSSFIRPLLCSRLALEIQQQIRPSLLQPQRRVRFELYSCGMKMLALRFLVQTWNLSISQSFYFLICKMEQSILACLPPELLAESSDADHL